MTSFTNTYIFKNFNFHNNNEQNSFIAAIAVCLKYVVKGLEATKKQYGSDCPSAEVTSVLAYLQAVDTVKHSTDAQLASRLIEQFQLAREHIPTHYINSKEVWLFFNSPSPARENKLT